MTCVERVDAMRLLSLRSFVVTTTTVFALLLSVSAQSSQPILDFRSAIGVLPTPFDPFLRWEYALGLRLPVLDATGVSLPASIGSAKEGVQIGWRDSGVPIRYFDVQATRQEVEAFHTLEILDTRAVPVAGTTPPDGLETLRVLPTSIATAGENVGLQPRHTQTAIFGSSRHFASMRGFGPPVFVITPEPGLCAFLLVGGLSGMGLVAQSRRVHRNL